MALVTCASEFCPDENLFSRPDPGDVYAPWVKMRFQDSGRITTVGNKSFYIGNPDNGEHTAVIKSFEFGASDGFTCSITILDQKGSNFNDFMTRIIGTLEFKEAKLDQIYISFGWIRILCDGTVQTLPNSCEFLIHGLEIEINFTEGMFIYTFTGKDLGTYMIESAKFEGNVGEDGKDEGGRDKGVPLTEAINAMLTNPNLETNSPPYVNKVRFLKDNGPGNDPSPILFNHRDGTVSEKGPIEPWRGNQRDKLNTAKGWVEQYTAITGAKNGRPIEKTVKPMYNSCDGIDEIVFWADKSPAPNEYPNTFNTVACYYVNGGKDSRVIEFNPSIKTNFGLLSMAGGNIPPGVALDKDAAKVQPHPNTDTTVRDKTWKSSGTDTSVSPAPGLSDRNKKNAGVEAGKGQAVQARGLSLDYLPIQADLVLVGDPRYMPFTHLWKNVTIIFINPFHLLPSNLSNCGEWLAEPPCNKVLTNRGWYIQRINHRIQEGSFTTTLNLYLPTPDVTLDKNIPFGADPKGFNPAGNPPG